LDWPVTGEKKKYRAGGVPISLDPSGLDAQLPAAIPVVKTQSPANCLAGLCAVTFSLSCIRGAAGTPAPGKQGLGSADASTASYASSRRKSRMPHGRSAAVVVTDPPGDSYGMSFLQWEARSSCIAGQTLLAGASPQNRCTGQIRTGRSPRQSCPGGFPYRGRAGRRRPGSGGRGRRATGGGARCRSNRAEDNRTQHLPRLPSRPGCSCPGAPE
jgi:hypothetical protein